jgi:hypothetical protein
MTPKHLTVTITQVCKVHVLATRRDWFARSALFRPLKWASLPRGRVWFPCLFPAGHNSRQPNRVVYQIPHPLRGVVYCRLVNDVSACLRSDERHSHIPRQREAVSERFRQDALLGCCQNIGRSIFQLGQEGFSLKASVTALLKTIEIVLYWALLRNLSPDSLISGMDPQERCTRHLIWCWIAKGFQVCPLNEVLRFRLASRHFTSLRGCGP